MKKVSVIIVHFNDVNNLKNLLNSISISHDIEVIVVDSVSKQSIDHLEKKFKQVKFIQLANNRGFAFACNRGIVRANGRWLLFLNPDIKLTTGDIRNLVKQAKRDKLDAVSPDFGDNRYFKPVPSLLSLLIEFTPLNMIIPLSIFKHKTLVGGCLLIKRLVIEELGGWDERFFLWFEDSDLSKRLLNANYSYGFVNSKIKHIGGTSLKKMDECKQKQLFFTSMWVYVLKHFSFHAKWVIKQLIKRYLDIKASPILNNGLCLVVPNLKFSILKHFLEDNASYLKDVEELIIISSDLSINKLWDLRTKYPNIRFINIANNHGFASTVNIGFRTSTYQYVGTVNDDTIFSSNWYEQCISKIQEDKSIGSINPIIYNVDNNIESVGIKILKRGKAVPLTTIDKKNNLNIVDATNAAAVIYQQATLQKVGLFDEIFGSYLEDIDLSLRLNKQGFSNVVSNKTSITHLKHQSSKDLRKYKKWNDIKNWWLVIIKNWDFKTLIRNFPAIFLERLRNIVGFFKSH